MIGGLRGGIVKWASVQQSILTIGGSRRGEEGGVPKSKGFVLRAHPGKARNQRPQ